MVNHHVMVTGGLQDIDTNKAVFQSSGIFLIFQCEQVLYNVSEVHSESRQSRKTVLHQQDLTHTYREKHLHFKMDSHKQMMGSNVNQIKIFATRTWSHGNPCTQLKWAWESSIL